MVTPSVSSSTKLFEFLSMVPQISPSVSSNELLQFLCEAFRLLLISVMCTTRCV